MKLGNLDKLNAYKKKLETKAASSGYTPNANFIQFKPGNTYRFRLLFADPDGTNREKLNTPFLNRYTHKCKDANDETQFVVCPTSEYVDGEPGGFKKCPICTNNSALFKKWKENESPTTRALYDTFKRQFSGFALVYVVSDSSNEENNGKVRIMRYGKRIKEYLNREVFGIQSPGDKEASSDAEEPFGAAAFDLDAGHDLKIHVKQNAEGYNEYSTSFTRGTSAINVDLAELGEMIDVCEFDKEVGKVSSYEEVNAFYKKNVLNEEYENPSTDSSLDDLAEDAPVKPKVIPTATKKPAAPVDEDDEFDIDQIAALVDEVAAEID